MLIPVLSTYLFTLADSARLPVLQPHKKKFSSNKTSLRYLPYLPPTAYVSDYCSLITLPLTASVSDYLYCSLIKEQMLSLTCSCIHLYFYTCRLRSRLSVLQPHKKRSFIPIKVHSDIFHIFHLHFRLLQPHQMYTSSLRSILPVLQPHQRTSAHTSIYKLIFLHLQTPIQITCTATSSKSLFLFQWNSTLMSSTYRGASSRF
jgi:hypothetical protein